MTNPFDDRELCPDGACIGVIGPDGRCKECGKPGTRPASRPASEPDDLEPDEPDEDDADDSAADAAAAPAEPEAGGDGEWDDRALCTDGACIGVIGPDGRCRECGKPA